MPYKGGGGLEPPYKIKGGREGGRERGGGLSESVKKGEIATKIFLLDVE